MFNEYPGFVAFISSFLFGCGVYKSGSLFNPENFLIMIFKDSPVKQNYLLLLVYQIFGVFHLILKSRN